MILAALVVTLALVYAFGFAAKRPSDPTIGARTQLVVKSLRHCQDTAWELRKTYNTTQQLVRPTLGSLVVIEMRICRIDRKLIATYNTSHFADQAVAAETAVDAYGAFMAKLHAYIITPKGSGIVAARSALQRANSETTDAIAEINRQRRHYGFGNI